jgi:hypothetical protein
MGCQKTEVDAVVAVEATKVAVVDISGVNAGVGGGGWLVKVIREYIYIYIYIHTHTYIHIKYVYMVSNRCAPCALLNRKGFLPPIRRKYK